MARSFWDDGAQPVWLGNAGPFIKGGCGGEGGDASDLAGSGNELWEAYATFVAAYRDAAERLRGGGPDPPRFPAGCFPPALPFVGV